uniref:KRAB domain-containing protein n=1 Tax=Chelonoidis abingdonii TaxID=106734 RepID=A0A8C0G9G8_CHEAB
MSWGRDCLCDVAIYFSREEWEMLAEWQKELYRDVMKEHYDNLSSLGHADTKPDVLSRLEQGEEPWVMDQQEERERLEGTSQCIFAVRTTAAPLHQCVVV